MVADDNSEKTLAAAYADVHNKTGWLMHELDDDACAPDIEQLYEMWSELEKELRTRIIEILKSENETEYQRTVNENKGYYNVVKPFMLRNGYKDGRGWWIQRKECEDQWGDTQSWARISMR